MADDNARILILGAFPGEESLRQQQYFAHPRNLFWDLMGEICGAGRDKPYSERLQIVRQNAIALWDVVDSCDRTGSMDADIRRGGFTVNDFKEFLKGHRIEVIFFDGRKAAELFQRYVIPTLSGVELPERVILPSTSPAHAALSRSQKLQHWMAIHRYLPKAEATKPTSNSDA